MPEEKPAVRAMWSGTISFGLVSVPVDLFPGARKRRIHLRMLDKDGTPLSRRYACPEEEVEADSEHIIRGYEIEPEKFVLVEDEELEALEPQKSRDIDLQRFVDKDDIEPLFFDHPYFLAPSGESVKGYRLLARVMEEENLAGIASFVMRDREYLVAIVAENGILQAETLRFSDEIRDPEKLGLPERKAGNKREIAQFEEAIKQATKPKFAESDLKDEYTEQIERLLQLKRKQGQEIVQSSEEAPAAEEPTVSDLMSVLKERLAGGV